MKLLKIIQYPFWYITVIPIITIVYFFDSETRANWYLDNLIKTCKDVYWGKIK